MINILQKVKWYFPPTTNRQGISKSNHDIKEIIVVETDLFDYPVIAMSDIHSQAPDLVKMLDDHIKLDQFVVLTAGDMAGQHIRGTDGDPTPEYTFLNDKAKEFYFVQGNHDLPDKYNAHNKLKNKQGNYASIKDGSKVKTLIGSISGVNGIISDKVHPYKMSYHKYTKYLRAALGFRPYILITHDTPAIPVNYNDGRPYKGNNDLFKIINKYRPKIHFYGHCYHPQFHNYINGVNYINLDA